jgi:F-type H+-transporting ATPase subunit epsilon
MADTFLLEVATPESLLLQENVTEAQIPAKNGYVGILPGHAALLSELGEGALTYVCEGRRRSLHVSGGLLEVSNDHVRVLAETASKAEEPA